MTYEEDLIKRIRDTFGPIAAEAASVANGSHKPVIDDLSVSSNHACKVCGVEDSAKAMAFRGVPWCCENHRKRLAGEAEAQR